MITENILQRCGLNATEAKVLLSLLIQGDVGGGILAKRTDIKRTTVYTALARLETLGIVSRRRIKTKTLYALVSAKRLPAVLKSAALSQFQDVENAVQILEESLAEMPQRKRHNLAGFEVSTVETAHGVYQTLENALIEGDYCGFFNPQTALVGVLKDLAIEYLNKSARERPHIREIMISGPMAKWWRNKITNPNHLVKEISAKEIPHIATDILLVNNNTTVILNNYTENNERSVVIHDADYFTMMQLMFDQLWSRL